MAETKSLAASVRRGVGKGAARSVRREGRIPGVVYGGGAAPTPISLSWHDVNKLIYAGHFLTTAFELDIDGQKERVIPRDYQLDPVKDRPLHVDFLRIKAGSKILVEVPVKVSGEDASPGLKQGGVLNLVRHVLELRVNADAIPEAVEVDVASMAIGDSKHRADVSLPQGAQWPNQAENFTVLTIAAPVEDTAAESTAAEPGKATSPEGGAKS